MIAASLQALTDSMEYALLGK
ncbi:MAG TPA: hypothetical protein PKE47_17470 [Verrucomicrobiota bacterium]|nr:hypothetical protein [Verrucomicrobiota bacterium]